MSILSTDKMTENDVVSLTAAYLKADGWTVHRALTVHQKGVDIFAERASTLLYAEAKGAVNSRTGKQIDTYGASHSALMQASSIRTRDDEARVVIVLPDVELYRFHMNSISRVLEAARIEVWLMHAGGSIRTIIEATEPVRWAQPPLPTRPIT